MSRLLLIRHGETALNVARVLQPADTPLSERGHRQAEALAGRLAAGTPNTRETDASGIARVAMIVSSDLPRALQTAEAIARTTGAPIETSPLWRERDFGDWRGRAYDALGPDPLGRPDAPPNGESLTTFEARVAEAFRAALARHAELALADDAAVAIVTHGLVIRTLFERHLSWPVELVRPTRLGNTGLSVVDARAPYRLQLADCTRHLDAAEADDAASLSGG